MIKFLENIGDFFSSNYFDEDFVKKVHDKSGFSFDDQKELQKRITPLKSSYYRYKKEIIEGRLRIKDKIYETHQFHTRLLNALGYDGDSHQYDDPFHFSEKEVLPIRHKLYRGDKLHLLIMEMQPLIKEGEAEPDGLFEQRYSIEEEEHEIREQRYHRSQWSRVFKVSDELKISPVIINKAISELSLLDQKDRPQYILLLAGNKVFLVECEKWMRGSYLKFDLEELFTEGTIDRKYYSLFYLLLSKEMLAPDSEMVLMDQLDEDSHKSAYEVTKDLKEGIIHAVEALANEALYYKTKVLNEKIEETDDSFERDVKDDCLSIVYRLLFVFYAESRADLDILPISEKTYQKGYSLEMLRDLEQTQLITDHSRNGYFFHESLRILFELMSSGYREGENGANKSFRIRHIDSPMFDDNKLKQLKTVQFRNVVWQDVICQLSLSRKQKKKARGRISYANLGINQLGSVYESLLAYRGFYAEEDYIEVHPKGKPKEGTLLVQRSRRDDFHTDEVLKDATGKEVVIPKGQFVYRLSGRDRQKSASYYTPEVLTQCTVKYTLKSILEKVERREMKALDLLDLKLLEPAMGAAAFHNELINQLAEAYLSNRQRELKAKISPEKYREELQKVKAYIATNNAYGVDLNPTAIELGKLSLWLNVIHKDMETPFFANRLATGNAVVGAWFKVYTEAQLKKKWWEKAPKLLQLGPDGEKRKKNEIYHFLLPDKGMVPSAGIKLLKNEYPDHAKRVIDWRKHAIKPISGGQLLQLQLICDAIDQLLDEYAAFQKRLNAQTKNKVDIWGGIKDEEQIDLNLRSYDEKEQLNDQRNRQSAPYYKLKMVMDYWCSLWFWDVRKAEFLPSRQQYINDIANILKIELKQRPKKEERANSYSHDAQLSLLGEDMNIGALAQDQIIEQTKKGDLFDEKERLEEVKKLSSEHRFFHNQLEFVEVFKERGGFDVIVGNPPWVNITMDEAGILSERNPEIAIRKNSAPQVKKLSTHILAVNPDLEITYNNEFIWAESTKEFLGSIQNYHLLEGQRNNLYKCILSNSYELASIHGFIGLIHPEGVYDDPKGRPLRKELYKRLKYHFQFRNEFVLFQEVMHTRNYSINIYKGRLGEIDFININNLFHPATIDAAFIHNGQGNCPGIKEIDASGKSVWCVKPHADRVVNINESSLRNLFDDFKKEEIDSPLTSIHSKQLLSASIKLKKFKSETFNRYSTDCLNETNAPKDGVIDAINLVPEKFEDVVLAGPNFYVGNPLYRTANEVCKKSSDYSIIEPLFMNKNELPRSIYRPNRKLFDSYFQSVFDKNWLEHTKCAFNKMLDSAVERTIKSVLIPPGVSHINGVISTVFEKECYTIEFAGLSASIVVDFIIKSSGKGNIYENTIESLPIGISDKYRNYLNARCLLLNCLNSYFSSIWKNNWKDAFINDDWSSSDVRLKSFKGLVNDWKWETPLRNYFERRYALIEIDVITAMALDLTLQELILIYNVQFPVLQQNEDDTWYDTTGNIVFTCSKGLTGVGVDRPVWNTIKDLKAGETYEHTIEKSELYYGKKVTYHAPFDKCDRVEDYKVAWAHFEKVFKEK